MKRFFKRLALLLFLSLAGLIGYGFYKGMTIDEMKAQAIAWYEEYIPISAEEPESPSQHEESLQNNQHNPSSSNKAPSPKNTAKKSAGKEYKLLPKPKNPFAKIDRHAHLTPSNAEKSIPALAAYLTKTSKNDLEKARAIYIWLTDNISYDDKGFNTDQFSPTDSESVLKYRKGVCSGFANLYYSLGQEAGLNIKKVGGYSKGYSYTPGDKFEKADHAWNLININGKWRIFDATWGQGYGTNVKGKLKSTKKFGEFWFNTSPYEAIFTHLPEDTRDAHVSPPIGLREFEYLPEVNKQYFETGFDAYATYLKVRKNNSLQFPKTYNPHTHCKIKKAPPYRVLKTGKAYPFQLYAPRAYAVAVIDANKDFHHFKREKGNFSLSYTPKTAGELKISIKSEDSEESYWTLLIYQVEPTDISS